MSATVVFGLGFPNPAGWAVDQASSAIGGAASAGFDAMVGGLVGWVVDAAVWVVGAVFGFFINATDPNLQADWFIGSSGPYTTTAAIGAVLLMVFAFAGIAQGTLSGDVGGMLRRMMLDLPISVMGMVGLVTVTQVLVELTDVLSAQVMTHFEPQMRDFTKVVASLGSVDSGHTTAFVLFVLGVVTVLAGIALVAELVVREALIYVVVALAPLVLATRLWPATRGAARKLLELLCALIFSKLVIAVALAVAAAAAVGVGSGGESTAITPPEAFTGDTTGSVGSAVGILLAAGAAFGVAAFSPLLVARLLPMTEAAVVGQGVRGGPVRAGQQGLMMANSSRALGGGRLTELAGGRSGPAVSAGAGSGPGAFAAKSQGAGGGAAAAAGPAAAAIAAVEVVRGAAGSGAAVTKAVADSAGSTSDTSGRSPKSRQLPSTREPVTGSRPRKPAGDGRRPGEQ